MELPTTPEDSINSESVEENVSEEDEFDSEINDDEPEQDVKINVASENSALFNGTEITELNLNQFSGPIHIKSPKEQKFSCPYCDSELEIKQYGKHKCEHCKRTFILRNRVKDQEIFLYKTLIPDDAKRFDKILSHINNHLQDRNYDAAFQYCKKAEELAPGEVSTWRNFALVEFLLEINKPINVRKSTFVIIKIIKCHIEKCKDHGMDEDEYETLVVDIANRLFNIERARINSVRPSYFDEKNNPKWSKGNLAFLQNLLRSFEICYSLYPDNLFLEGYIEELTKDYKWLVKNAEGALISNVACGSFDAVKKLYALASKIEEKRPGYILPPIAEERFCIKNSQYLKINLVDYKP